MTFAAESILTFNSLTSEKEVKVPRRGLLDIAADYLPTRFWQLAAIGILAFSHLFSADSVQAAPLHSAINPESRHVYHNPDLLLYSPPDSVEPQGWVTSVDCPPLPVAGGYEINYQPPIVTCEVTQSEDQNVLQFDILPPNRQQSVYMINPAPGYLVITSTIPDFHPFLAFYTNYKQRTLTPEQIGSYLFEQDQPVIMQINGHDVPVKAKGTDVIVRYDGDNIVFEDGTTISYVAFIKQMFISSGLDPNDYDLGATIQAPMIAVASEITDLFPYHVTETATPTPNPWLYSPTETPEPSYANPINATASLGPVRDLQGNVLAIQPTFTSETIPTIESLQAPITGLTLDFGLVDGKVKLTHPNPDTRNPIASPTIDNIKQALPGENRILQVIAMGDELQAEAGTPWDNLKANIWVGGKYKHHYQFITERLPGTDIGKINVRAVYVDDNHLAHIVGTDASGGIVVIELPRRTLKSFAKHDGFIQSVSADGTTNEILNEVLENMLTVSVQVNRQAFIMPSQYSRAARNPSTWAQAWQAATALGSVPCFLADKELDPATMLPTVCPVGMEVQPDGIIFDSFGTPYVATTVTNFPSGVPYSSGDIVMVRAENLVITDEQH